MNKLIFLFLFSQYFAIISSQCSDSVGINTILANVKEKDIFIFLNAKFLNITNPSEYVEKCVDFLKCSIKSKNVSYQDINYYIKKQEIDETIKITFSNLTALKTYNISIGLKLKNSTDIISKFNVTLSNCFGEPGKKRIDLKNFSVE